MSRRPVRVLNTTESALSPATFQKTLVCLFLMSSDILVLVNSLHLLQPLVALMGIVKALLTRVWKKAAAQPPKGRLRETNLLTVTCSLRDMETLPDPLNKRKSP